MDTQDLMLDTAADAILSLLGEGNCEGIHRAWLRQIVLLIVDIGYSSDSRKLEEQTLALWSGLVSIFGR